jgi:hypothetical protein
MGEDRQRQRVVHVDRLILIMNFALYWAVSTGMRAVEIAVLTVGKMHCRERDDQDLWEGQATLLLGTVIRDFFKVLAQGRAS